MKQSHRRLAITQAIENKVHTLDMKALLKLAADLKVPVPVEVKEDAGRGPVAARSTDATGNILAGKGLGSIVPALEGARRLDQITADELSTDWAESELLGAGEVVHRLNISRATLDNWRKGNKVIALRKGLRNYVYPVRQFERLKPVNGLDRLAALFSSPEEVWEWLVTPNRMTDSDAPIEKLRKGTVELVISAAEGALDYS